MTAYEMRISDWSSDVCSSDLVASKHAATVGNVLSQIGITTRNRDHANHAQNNVVFRPEIVGPSPKSYCNHSPGSVTHGRYTRRRPARNWAFASATVRRAVRSPPVKDRKSVV